MNGPVTSLKQLKSVQGNIHLNKEPLPKPALYLRFNKMLFVAINHAHHCHEDSGSRQMAGSRERSDPERGELASMTCRHMNHGEGQVPCITA